MDKELNDLREGFNPQELLALDKALEPLEGDCECGCQHTAAMFFHQGWKAGIDYERQQAGHAANAVIRECIELTAAILLQDNAKGCFSNYYVMMVGKAVAALSFAPQIAAGAVPVDIEAGAQAIDKVVAAALYRAIKDNPSVVDFNELFDTASRACAEAWGLQEKL